MRQSTSACRNAAAFDSSNFLATRKRKASFSGTSGNFERNSTSSARCAGSSDSSVVCRGIAATARRHATAGSLGEVSAARGEWKGGYPRGGGVFQRTPLCWIASRGSVYNLGMRIVFPLNIRGKHSRATQWPGMQGVQPRAKVPPEQAWKGQAANPWKARG